MYLVKGRALEGEATRDIVKALVFKVRPLKLNYSMRMKMMRYCTHNYPQEEPEKVWWYRQMPPSMLRNWDLNYAQSQFLQKNAEDLISND